MNHAPVRDAGGTAPVLNLALILNTLLRGRALLLATTLLGVAAGVVYGLVRTPLYLAAVQVRPGVVAYSDAGGPVREDALKDIVQWFRSGFYGPVLAEDPRFDAGAPLIDAEFIPTGPQFERGGSIVTLSVYDPDPERALAALNGAVDAYNRQGGEGREGSTIALTRGGANIRITKKRNDLDQVQTEEARKTLQVQARERERDQIDARIAHAERRLTRLEHEQATHLQAAVVFDEEIVAGRRRLAEADSLLRKALAVEAGTTTLRDGRVGDNDPVTELLLQTASREQAARAGELLATVSSLEARLAQRAVEAASERDAAAKVELELAQVRLDRDVNLPKLRADTEQAIAELHLELERDLPYRRAQLEADIAAEQLRVDILQPLEPVGVPMVSENPVRPRRLRATAILAFLGLVGGVFLVFVREYFRRNRDAILAPPPAA